MKNRERMLKTTTYEFLVRLNEVLEAKGHCIFDLIYKSDVLCFYEDTLCGYEGCSGCIALWLNAEEEETRTAEQFEDYIWRKTHVED